MPNFWANLPEILIGLTCLVVILTGCGVTTLLFVVAARLAVNWPQAKVEIQTSESAPKPKKLGPYCSHCQESLPTDVTLGIAAGKDTIRVYRCGKCKKETLLK